MKRTKLIALAGIISVSLFTLPSIQSLPTGAPSAASGGPAEGGATCSQGGCHGGTATPISTYMSTDIPSAGYTPGTTYNIVVSMAASYRKGFMFSAQNSSGQFLGSLTAGTGSRVTLTNYITHSSSKSTNPAVWTFKWTAPAAGSGTVGLYGAFALSTFTTYTQVINVNEKLSSGLNELAQEMGLNTYFNTTDKQLGMTFNLKNSSNVTVSLVNMNGQVCADVFSGNMQAGEQNLTTQTAALKAGIYLVQIQVGNQVAFKKVAITE